jgi:prephenate dehydratase
MRRFILTLALMLLTLTPAFSIVENVDLETIIDIALEQNQDIKIKKLELEATKKDIKIGENKRTSIVFNTKNESGALLNILEIFKKHNLNLIYLESRPSKKVFGEYNFFADIDKGIEEIGEVLFEVREKCNFYKLLGSYSIE